jgi:succinylglutamate desuccinylase
VPAEVERLLGRVRGARPGPTLLCIAGLHGNEPAGVEAARSVLERLAPRAGAMRGDVVALAGNRRALAAGCRFVERDLNRAWTDERLHGLRAAGRGRETAEDQEQVELLDAIEEAVEAARGPVYVLDLHTTSGTGGAFTTFGDTLPNRMFAAHLPVPMILGIEELLEGTLLAFLGRHGLVGVAFETGQHDEPAAVERAVAGIWVQVAALGLLPGRRLREAREGRAYLRRAAGGLPRVMEMRYRHPVAPSDQFHMHPGWRNFQVVRRGQVLARDARGEVLAREGGRILMPLYQAQGEDGFFLIRAFAPFWLQASRVLRSLGLDRVVHMLPGIERDRTRPDALIVHRSVARWYALQLFHLLGYRRQEVAGDHLVMRRRRYDDMRYVRRGPLPEPLE